jgi:hypothetical protein
VARLSELDPDCLLVFARYGRSGAAGPYATCHCLTLPPTDPGYYYWCDKRSGRMTRRSEWFITKSPQVSIDGRPVHYLISFVLPRFCDEALDQSRKRRFHPGQPSWIAKLDTIVHELYHIDPAQAGLRRVTRLCGGAAASLHGPSFLADVAAMVREYLASGADPAVCDFLRYGFEELSERFGRVVATTFRTFPSFPQRYIETLPAQPTAPPCACIQPLRQPQLQTIYTEHDLETRLFLPQGIASNARTSAMPVATERRQRASAPNLRQLDAVADVPTRAAR